jgi:hypothetical protein
LNLEQHRAKLIKAIDHYQRAWGAKEVAMRYKPVFDAVNELYGLLGLTTGEQPAEPTFRLNTEKTVAVSANVYLEKCDASTPRGVKLQLLTAGGILVYGCYHGESWVTHWAPCPRRRD